MTKEENLHILATIFKHKGIGPRDFDIYRALNIWKFFFFLLLLCYFGHLHVFLMCISQLTSFLIYFIRSTESNV